MNNRLVSLAVASLLALGAAAPGAQAADAQSPTAADVQFLRTQLEALQAKVAELEKQQAAQQESVDRTTDVLAQTKSGVGEWVGRFTWKGDFRFRNENIDQQYNTFERNRDRIRLRTGFVAKVNDTIKAEVQLTTGETNQFNHGDARSSNQTLTGGSSRKNILLDLAYAEWSPNAGTKLTVGKMKYPWVRAGQTLLWDGDINPEGVALSWQQGALGFFGSAYYMDITERSGSGLLGAATAGGANSSMAGAQLGWRGDIASGNRLTVAAAYFAHGGVKGYNNFDVNTGNLNGNTLVAKPGAGSLVCRTGITSCSLNDFDNLEVIAQWDTSVAGYPLSIWGDYLQNTSAATAYDTAMTAGFMIGKASGPGTWELGYQYQKAEKDSQYGLWYDSDFAGGSTDGDGSVFRFAYAFAKNWRVNATYMLNELNNDVGASVAGVGTNVRDIGYKRLQLDLNYTF